MPARQHDRVLLRGVADDALALALVVEVGGVAIVPVDVLQVHYLVVVKHLLSCGLEFVVGSIFFEATISELTILAALTAIVLWVHSLDLNYNRAESFSDLQKILLLVVFQHLADVQQK